MVLDVGNRCVVNGRPWLDRYDVVFFSRLLGSRMFCDGLNRLDLLAKRSVMGRSMGNGLADNCDGATPPSYWMYSSVVCLVDTDEKKWRTVVLGVWGVSFIVDSKDLLAVVPESM